MHICEAPTPKNLRAPRRRVNSNRRKQTANAEFQKGENGEYWKLKRDGTLAYDGRANLYAEDGDDDPTNDVLVQRTENQGIEGSLTELLFGRGQVTDENRLLAQKLMVQSGLVHSGGVGQETDWQWGSLNGPVRMAAIEGFWPFTKDRTVNALDANLGKSINMGLAMDRFGGTISETVFNLYYENVITQKAKGSLLLSGRMPGQYEGSSWERINNEAEQWSVVFGMVEDYSTTYTNADLRKQFNSGDKKNKQQRISNDQKNNGVSPESLFYSYVGTGNRMINPLMDGNNVVTTQYYYNNDPNTPHSMIPGGAAADFAPIDIKNNPVPNPGVATTFNGYFDLVSSWGMARSNTGSQDNLGQWNSNIALGTGFTGVFFGNQLMSRYGHMQLPAFSDASRDLMIILDAARGVGMTKIWLPAGTQIGNMGYTGQSRPQGWTGTHLHFDYKRNWW